MGIKVPNVIKQVARDMRKNPTLTEKKLWNHIRRDISGYRFLRQKPLYVYTEDTGHDRFIIPDFYCFEKKLILEVDGSIHNVSEVLQLDKVKEELLDNLGIEVWRIKNEDVLENIERVILELKQKLS